VRMVDDANGYSDLLEMVKEHLQRRIERGERTCRIDPALLDKLDAARAQRGRGQLRGASSDKASLLAELERELTECKECPLWETRTKMVFGDGDPEARLVFVGEAPGRDEDLEGKPFVGRAGQLLTRIIEAVDLKREDVYICNVLKCRPPGNRTPSPEEIHHCEPFLLRQLDIIQPAIIVALGAPAAQTLRHTKEAVGRLRGEFREFRGAKLMATYHPAACLRSPKYKPYVWDDMQKVRDEYRRTTG